MLRFLTNKLTLIAAIYVGISTSSSQAMNWEGHDDWMADLPAALVLQAATPVALPQRSLKLCRLDPSRDPYDQIPLPTDICRMGSPVKDYERSGAQP